MPDEVDRISERLVEIESEIDIASENEDAKYLSELIREKEKLDKRLSLLIFRNF